MQSTHRTRGHVFASLTGGAVLGAAVLGILPAGAQNTPPAAAQPPEAAHNFYPVAKAWPAPKIVIDVSDAPDALAFAENSKRLVEQWFPLVCQFLATDDYKPPKTLILAFKKDLSAPAYTTGAGVDAAMISVNDRWITAHPDDYGMMIHEMTHVIQSYPDTGDKPGWLVEGIADYIRFYRYEPDVSRRNVEPRHPSQASYRDAYRTTASFLAYVTAKYNKSTVSKLDGAMRAGTYTPALWQTMTGKGVDTLWAEYVQTLLPPTTPPTTLNTPAPSKV